VQSFLNVTTLKHRLAIVFDRSGLGVRTLLVMPFLLAMIVTIACMPLLGRIAARWNIVDRPGGRKVHSAPIPRIGGVAMVMGVLAAALIVIPLEPADRWFLVAAGILTIFGALDDRFDLDYRLKFLGQLIAVGVVVFAGDVQVQALTLDDRILLPEWVSVLLTLVFLIGITNAINLADGLDGLAGGTTFLCLCALAMLSHSVGELSSTALALAFAGAVLGFLRFNTFPASIFMGDAGSQLLGFTVGVLSIRTTQNGNGIVSAAMPILLLALPILDTLSVMVQRISEGRSPFSADKRHIHHKLLAFGFDHHEAVMVIYVIQAALFLLAYWMRFESDLSILAVVSAFFAVSIGLQQFATFKHWRLRSPKQGKADSPLSRLLTALRQPEHLPRWSYFAVALASLAYASLITAETARFSSDVRLLLMALLAITATWLILFRGKPLSTIEKSALYVTAAILVYLDSVIGHAHGVSVAAWIAMCTMAVGTALRLRLANDRRFELTPLDLIVLFVALVVPNLPGSIGLPDGGALGIAKLVVLFYAIEVLVSRTETQVVWLRFAATILLASLVIRPII
jgi:UDP-GlcNAc:undecaprenyl-phosphate GlcNAc-1-phosphate transferase